MGKKINVISSLLFAHKALLSQISGARKACQLQQGFHICKNLKFLQILEPLSLLKLIKYIKGNSLKWRLNKMLTIKIKLRKYPYRPLTKFSKNLHHYKAIRKKLLTLPQWAMCRSNKTPQTNKQRHSKLCVRVCI